MGDSSWKKLVIVGDGQCGKTSILQRYCHGRAPGDFEPTVFDNFAAQIEVRSVTRHLTIWDTSGQEDWASIRRLTYPEADVVLVTFDLSNRDSLENVSQLWVPEVRKFCPSVPIVLVGNKLDLRQQLHAQVISTAEGDQVATEIGAVHYNECSAKTGQGVGELFQTVAECIYPKEACLPCCTLQ